MGEFLANVGSERTGLLAAGVVAAVCAVISVAGWYPLSLPSRLIRDILPEADCVNEIPGTTSMYVCSAKVGALQVLGPVILMVGVFLGRKQIKAWLDNAAPSLPQEGRFLFAPAIATLAFTLSWAGFHYETSGQSGFLPQIIFPAVIGLFTYSVSRWGSDLQRSLSGFFDMRESIPLVLRFALLVIVPLGVSYLITNQERVSDTALKEQFVVVVALAMGFLMLAPRSGDALGGMGRAIGIERTTR